MALPVTCDVAASGSVFVVSAGQQLSCGTDSAGATLYLQVGSAADEPVDGGGQVGLDIGIACLSVMAVAFCIRTIRRFIEGSALSDGGNYED